MEEGKWTPGPWEIDRPGKPEQSVFARVTLSGTMARMFVCSIDTTEVDDHPEQADANARLIAAAPELFEALAEGVRLYSEYGLLANDHTCGRWIGAARAALLKASPESSRALGRENGSPQAPAAEGSN